jgi:hypothetical protein
MAGLGEDPATPTSCRQSASVSRGSGAESDLGLLEVVDAEDLDRLEDRRRETGVLP